jgi:hypothetical protein
VISGGSRGSRSYFDPFDSGSALICLVDFELRGILFFGLIGRHPALSLSYSKLVWIPVLLDFVLVFPCGVFVSFIYCFSGYGRDVFSSDCFGRNFLRYRYFVPYSKSRFEPRLDGDLHLNHW